MVSSAFLRSGAVYSHLPRGEPGVSPVHLARPGYASLRRAVTNGDSGRPATRLWLLSGQAYSQQGFDPVGKLCRGRRFSHQDEPALKRIAHRELGTVASITG